MAITTMMHLPSILSTAIAIEIAISISILVVASLPVSSYGFSFLSSHVTSPRVLSTRLLAFQDDSVDSIKSEIEEMRQEALRRIDALNNQLSRSNTTDPSTVGKSMDADSVVKQSSPQATVDKNHKPTPSTVATNRPSYHAKSIARVKKQEVSTLLDDTRWKIMLNVGREPGTWMPKTWGVSGERLLLNLEVDFLPDQLYEREEFLNGMAGAKVLEVVHGELTMGPSMTEGARKISTKSGGWRVAQGEGPMGTDLLRFYIELEDEVRHRGRDVHCPKGRVYCTCGFFALNDRHQTGNLKESLKQQLDFVSQRYEQLSREDDENKSLSWTKMKRAKEMVDLRIEADKLNVRMSEARVKEPEKGVLRLSRDQDVGLTREGGICCKVIKRLATEYHILGKFQVASIEIREVEEHDANERLRS